MKKERCWSLGRTFQCIPESATNVQWNGKSNSWEYQSKKVNTWKKAPLIGEYPSKYIYPTTFKSPFTRSTFKKSIIMGFLFIFGGILGLYINEKNGNFVESVTTSASDWLIAILCVFIVVYLVLFLTYRIWNRQKYSL